MHKKLSPPALAEIRQLAPAKAATATPMSRSAFTQKWVYSLLLGALYAYLFYPFEIGLNVLIFDVFLLLFFLRTEDGIRSRPLFTIAAAGLLVSSFSVVIVHSWTATVAHIVSLLLVFGVARVREIRFIWFGLLLGVISIFRVPLDYLAHWKQAFSQRPGGKSLRLSYVLIPLLIGGPFLLIYYAANPSFAAVLDQVFGFGRFISPATLWLFTWGSWLGAALLFPYSKASSLAKTEAGFRDTIPRRGHRRFSFLPIRPSSLSLTHEYRMARFTFIGLNALLLIVNFTDLLGLLVFRKTATAAEFSQAVHSGTYLLMLSIMLAIGVVIFFFRGLLNYYPRVAELRQLAFWWIGQNAMLAVFVLARNMLYVQHSGLAWGRVLVFFWLALIGFGLLTLYRKVDQRLSLSYLLHANGLAAWLGLLLLGAINWDGVITRYNLATQPTTLVDYNYLIGSLDQGNTFLLVQDPVINHRYLNDLTNEFSDDYTQYQLKNKLRNSSRRRKDWRSWNYVDYRNYSTIQKAALNVLD